MSPLSPTADAPRREGFRRGLAELGYREGQNIAVEYRWAEVRLDRQDELAVELVRLKVDVIVAAGGPHTVRAAKKATGNIPIVMTIGPDSVAGGLVASLARPGGNVTGLNTMTAEVAAKRLELFGRRCAAQTRRHAARARPGGSRCDAGAPDGLPVAGSSGRATATWLIASGAFRLPPCLGFEAGVTCGPDAAPSLRGETMGEPIANDPLREGLGARLASGALPALNGQAWAGKASGDHRCACCLRPIPAGDMEYEPRDQPGRYAHVSCFTAWVSESRRVVVSRSPADALPPALEQEPA